MYKYISFFYNFVLLHDKKLFMANQTYILSSGVIALK